MEWYGVSVVMAVYYKTGPQDVVPIWENIYLISAHDSDEAQIKAAQIGKENEGDSGGSFFWNDRAATWVYKGIRKITKLSNSYSIQNIPTDGAEVTYQTLEFQDEQTLADYLDEKPVTVKVL